MVTQVDARDVLKTIEWIEGKIEPVVRGPYRYEIVIICSSLGRQKAVFADGEEHQYFSFFRMINSKGEWTGGRGGIVVPVLPNGRILMIIEQRPSQSLFTDRPKYIELDSGLKLMLDRFGPYGSLEFPGGGVESGEHFTAGFLRELNEETGVEKKGMFYARKRPHFQYVSEAACMDNLGVIYLEGMNYIEKTNDDGGLTVIALSEMEVNRNIWNGVISSSHAGLLPWYFYKEIEKARQSVLFLEKLCNSGYLEVRRVDL